MNKLASHLCAGVLVVMGAAAVAVAGPATQPTSQPGAGGPAVGAAEITILENAALIKGITWAPQPVGIGRNWPDVLDLTIHSIHGRTLHMRSRPFILTGDTECVLDVALPVGGVRGSLQTMGVEAERLLSAWDIRPDERMTAQLNGWKQGMKPGDHPPTQMIAYTLWDSQTWIGLKVQHDRVDPGVWTLTVKVQALLGLHPKAVTRFNSPKVNG